MTFYLDTLKDSLSVAVAAADGAAPDAADHGDWAAAEGCQAAGI